MQGGGIASAGFAPGFSPVLVRLEAVLGAGSAVGASRRRRGAPTATLWLVIVSYLTVVGE